MSAFGSLAAGGLLSRWDDSLTALLADPLGRLLLALSFFALVLVAVLLIIIPLLRRSLNLTFRRLVRGVEEIRRTGPSGQLPSDISGEARELVAGLNHLLGEIQERIGSLERQRNEARAVLDGPRDYGVLATDREGQIRFLSAGAAEMLGYSAEELIGRHVEVLLPEEDWNRILPKLARRSLRQSGVVQRVRLLRRDRSDFPASLSVVEFPLPEGGTGLAGVFRDLSAEAALEQQLQEAEQRHRSLVEGLGDGVLILQEGRIVSANRNLGRMLGLAPRELEGRPFKEFLLAEDILLTLNRLEGLLAGAAGESEEIALRLQRTEGTGPLEVRGSFSRIEHRGRPALLGCLRDETERRRFERDLTASRALLDTTLDSTSDGIAVVEARGGRRDIVLVNPRFEALLGFPGEEALAWSEERFHRELSNRGALAAELPPPRNDPSGDARSGALSLDLSAPQPRILELSYGPYRNPRGEISGRVYSFRDITERRRAEDSLRESHRALEASQKELQEAVAGLRAAREDLASRNTQLESLNQELRSLDEMKSSLLANVSHELQTPLVLIKGYTEMILKRKIGPLTPEQEKGLTVSLRNIDRLVEMIDNLLDFSRMERGEASLQLEEFPLWQVVDEVIELVREKIRSKGIYITTEYETDDLQVKADRAKISQVFINLLSNAIKFNREGGRILIRVSAGVRGMLDVEVKDTGIGIPAEAQGRIFERFYQADTSARKKYEGTGIGLSIVREILTMHGSSIRVDSSPGEGTTFAFNLPRGLSRTAPRPEGDGPRSAPAQNEPSRR
jgi:PAS domain S-box-containing protein